MEKFYSYTEEITFYLMNSLFEIGKCYRITNFWLYDYDKENDNIIHTFHEKITKHVNILVLDIAHRKGGGSFNKILFNGMIYWIYSSIYFQAGDKKNVQRISND